MTKPSLAPRAVLALTRRRHPAPAAPAPAAPGPAAGAAGSAAGRPWHAGALLAARRHWLAGVLLCAGVVLRVLALAAYRPALIYVDTLKYLYGASPGSEPLGYLVVIKPLVPLGGLMAVAAAQHLAGLAMAALLYAVLLRRGVPRWAAALACAPVLLDAYQVQMEQMIMPDVWFEALIVTAIAVLLWRPAVSVPFAIAAGLVLGSSATIKQLGEILVFPALAYLLATGEGRRGRLRAAAALCAAFLLPVLAYCGVSYARTGHFWLAHKQTDTGRLMAAADCATLRVSRAAHLLCPTPAEQANGPDWLEHSASSPLYSRPARLPPGVKRGRLIGELKGAVIHQQPLRVVGSIASDSLRLFALTRQPSQWVTPISRWQFQAGYPTYPPWTSICRPGKLSAFRSALGAQACMVQQVAVRKRVAPVTGMLLRPGGTLVVGVQRRAFGAFHARNLRPSYGGPARVDRPLARFLRSYQLGGGYTPGPLLALFALAGLAGSVLSLTGRGRDGASRLPARACLLFTVTALVVLLLPDFYEFSWRYQLPAVITLPPAGVLGTVAVLRARRRLAGQAAPGAAGQAAPGAPAD